MSSSETVARLSSSPQTQADHGVTSPHPASLIEIAPSPEPPCYIIDTLLLVATISSFTGMAVQSVTASDRLLKTRI